MRSFSRPILSAVCGIVLVSSAAVGCSGGSIEEPELTKVSSDSSSAEAEAEDEPSASPEPMSNGSKPDCSPEAVEGSVGHEGEQWVVMECEGDFAFVGQSDSDFVFPVMWEDGKWTTFKADGRLEDGIQPACYNKSTLDRLGVGPRVRAHLYDCASEELFGGNGNSGGSGSSGGGGQSGYPRRNSDGYIVEVGLGEAGQKASFPACDGRYILLLDSVVDSGDGLDTFYELAEAVLHANPSGKEFTVPGQCDSLRKSVHGNDIYPVYLDFGSDMAAACRAKSTYGGSVRPLKNGSFPDASDSDVDEVRGALDPC
ncbi:hypothetical protein QYQ98_04585 [Corynebacterium sp. P3-F1]|uniref:hypothetical protein n=1 Tax=Corynebacterium sp. P3-F1 TaxID=3059080 RepID=UPI00265D01C5|nr:hypothetical protein [Corynebacterium sp. P3-F1]WKK62149.1 hypothetical protein QYQ98_04585 [Corynebacterium sp. P3-F1]